MPQVTPTVVHRKLPLGDRRVSIIRIASATGAQPDDHVVAGSAGTGLSWIDAILGCVPIGGTAAEADFPVFKKNVQQNSSGAEGDNPGYLNFETGVADTSTYEVTLLGKP